MLPDTLELQPGCNANCRRVFSVIAIMSDLTRPLTQVSNAVRKTVRDLDTWVERTKAKLKKVLHFPPPPNS